MSKRDSSELLNNAAWANSNARRLLDWIKNHEHRNCWNFEDQSQVAVLKTIASTDDKEVRESMLLLFDKAVCLHNQCRRLHGEMETIYKALASLDATLSHAESATECEPGGGTA